MDTNTEQELKAVIKTLTGECLDKTTIDISFLFNIKTGDITPEINEELEGVMSKLNDILFQWAKLNLEFA